MFSHIANDQAHPQSNKSLQTHGLTVWLYKKLDTHHCHPLLSTIQVMISYYSLHRMAWNISLLLFYLKSICSICHGKIKNVAVSRIDTMWNKDRPVYVSQYTDWPRNYCQTGHHRGTWCDSHWHLYGASYTKFQTHWRFNGCLPRGKYLNSSHTSTAW